MISLLIANYKDALLILHNTEAVCNKNQQNAHYFNEWSNSIIVSSTCFQQSRVHPQEDCTCSFKVFFPSIRIRSLVDFGMCLIPCRRHCNWIKSLTKKVCTFFVLITYVYHNITYVYHNITYVYHKCTVQNLCYCVL
jgi:hypothetical protein